MLRRIEIERGHRPSADELRPAGTGIDAEVIGVAQRIIDEVKARGDEAVRELTEQLDHVVLGDLRVSDEEIEAALSAVDERFRRAISDAAWAIEDFHRRQVQQSWFTTGEDGVVLGQLVSPIRRVGIYVPGGRARYPSSVLMNAIPAIVAGVEEIAMVVPPAPDGSVDPHTLAAAAEVGVTEIYKIGGAQAIAALAYGTESIPRVDKITGPGNAYVTAAKKLVMGEVGIDMLAGPSEVLIVADETAEPLLVAIDLMAQAEHDPRAATFLVTTDPELPEAVEEAIRELLEDSPRSEVIVRALQDNGVAVVCPDIDVALDVANEIAPEHLELHVEVPFELLGRVRNAGAVFLGPWTPESVGDYVAGPNHVLPTGGTARFSSPLSVDDFVKKSSVISYTLDGLYADGAAVMEIASAEGLAAHAAAVGLRLALAEHVFEQDEDEEESS
ncbi:histidinol dehydrogenase [Coriobacteriaceae bacterium EMTCatB1]|nr:histidinol dehydrogenase [Coriobacteriaceae bacterium EMTCatB1]